MQLFPVSKTCGPQNVCATFFQSTNLWPKNLCATFPRQQNLWPPKNVCNFFPISKTCGVQQNLWPPKPVCTFFPSVSHQQNLWRSAKPGAPKTCGPLNRCATFFFTKDLKHCMGAANVCLTLLGTTYTLSKRSRAPALSLQNKKFSARGLKSKFELELRLRCPA